MFASRVLRMCATSGVTNVKATTGIVGLEVVPDARLQLIKVYRQTLQAVSSKLPAHNPYRRSVVQMTKFRLGVVEKTEDVSKIEEEIGCGQIEELLVQAKEEYELIPALFGEGNYAASATGSTVSGA